MQKRLNRSRCRLGCGLGWAEGSKFNRIRRLRQCAPMRGHIGGDAALCQITLTTCSGFYQFSFHSMCCTCLSICFILYTFITFSNLKSCYYTLLHFSCDHCPVQTTTAASVLALSKSLCRTLVIIFRVRRSRGEIYIGHGRLCDCVSVCVSVCPSPHSHSTARTRM